MGFWKDLQSAVSGRVPFVVGARARADVGQQHQADLVPFPVRYSDDPNEARLAGVWKTCTQEETSHRKVSNHSARLLLSVLQQLLDTWVPLDMNYGAGASTGPALPPWLPGHQTCKSYTGCHIGHPQELTEFLCNLLAASIPPTPGSSQNVSTRIEAAPDPQMLSNALACLEKMLESWYNRQVFARVGGLAVTAALLQSRARALSKSGGDSYQRRAFVPALRLAQSYIQGQWDQRERLLGELQQPPGEGRSGSVPHTAWLFAVTTRGSPSLCAGLVSVLEVLVDLAMNGPEINVVLPLLSEVLELISYLALGSATAAAALRAAGVVPPLCRIATSHSPCLLAALNGQDPSKLALLPSLYILRLLRKIIVNPDSPSGAASVLLKGGIFAALTRMLVRAAALPLGIPDETPEVCPMTEPMELYPPAPREDGTELNRLFPELRARSPELHALMAELLLWLGTATSRHDMGGLGEAPPGPRADVVAPLCSALLDCFAAEKTELRLEQPSALLDHHMALTQQVTACSVDLQRCTYTFLTAALAADCSCPHYLNPLRIVPVLLGPAFFQHSMVEEVVNPNTSIFGSMALDAFGTVQTSSGGGGVGGGTSRARASQNGHASAHPSGLHTQPAAPQRATPNTLSRQSSVPTDLSHGTDGAVTGNANVNNGVHRNSMLTPVDTRDEDVTVPPQLDVDRPVGLGLPMVQTGFEPLQSGALVARAPAAGMQMSRSQLSECLSQMNVEGESGTTTPADLTPHASREVGQALGPTGLQQSAGAGPHPAAGVEGGDEAGTDGDGALSSVPITIQRRPSSINLPATGNGPEGSVGDGEGSAATPASDPTGGTSPCAANFSYHDVAMPHSLHSAQASSPGALAGSYCDVETFMGRIQALSQTPSGPAPRVAPGALASPSFDGAPPGRPARAATQGPPQLSIRSVDASAQNAISEEEAATTVLRPSGATGLPEGELSELRDLSLNLIELWVIHCVEAKVSGAPDMELTALLDRVRRSLMHAKDLAGNVLELLDRLCADRSAVMAALVRCNAPQVGMHLLNWLYNHSPDGAASALATRGSRTESLRGALNTVESCAGGAEADPATSAAIAACAHRLRDLLMSLMHSDPTAARAVMAGSRTLDQLLTMARGGWPDHAVPLLTCLIYTLLSRTKLRTLVREYLVLLRDSTRLPQGTSFTLRLLQGLQPPPRKRDDDHRRQLDVLREAGTLETVLSLGRHLEPAVRGSADAEAMLVECMNTIMSLVRGHEHMQAHFRKVGEGQAMELVQACMGSNEVQRDVLEILLRIVLEADYQEQGPVQQIVNVDAIPLFYQMLRKASTPAALWGLALWHRLAAESLVNTYACGKAGLISILLAWFNEPSMQPVVQIRVALLLKVLGPHTMTMVEFRKLFRMMQPLFPGEASDSKAVWRTLLKGLEGEDTESTPQLTPVLPHTAVIAHRLLCRMTQESGPSAFFHLAPKPGVSAGFQRSSPTNVFAHSFAFSTWLRLDSATQAGSSAAPTTSLLFALLSADPAVGRNRPDVPRPSGVIATISADKIGVQMVLASGLRTFVQGTFALVPRRWHHIAVVAETTTKLLQPETVMAVFVDGARADQARARISRGDPASYYSVGTELAYLGDGVPTPAALNGQLGCTHLFDRAITTAEVKALFHLGYNYLGNFSPKETAVEAASSAETGPVFDVRKGLSVAAAASYVPKAVEGSRLLDTSQKGGQSVGGSEADLLPGTSVCYATRPNHLLQALGGVSALLPLLLLADIPMQKPAAGWLSDDDVAALLGDASSLEGALETSQDKEEVLGLQEFTEMLRGGLDNGPPWLWDSLGAIRSALEESSNRVSMVRKKGARLLSRLLCRLGTRFLTSKTLNCLRAIVNTVYFTKESSLCIMLWRESIVNLRLWCSASTAQQRVYFEFLRSAATRPETMCAKATVPGRAHTSTSLVHHTVPPEHVLDAIRGLLRPDLFVHEAPLPADGPGLAPREIVQQLLQLVGTLMHVPGGSALDAGGSPGGGPEMMDADTYAAFLSFLWECSDDALVSDTIGELYASLSTGKVGVPAAAARDNGGVLPLVQLLGRPSASVRCLVLRLMQLLLQADRLRGALLPAPAHAAGTWALLEANLSLQRPSHDVTSALLRVVVPGASGNGALSITNVALLPVLLRLIGRSTEDRVHALLYRLQTAVEASEANLSAVLSQPHWAEPLLDLLAAKSTLADGGSPREEDSVPIAASPAADPRTPVDAVRAMLSSLLAHGLLYSEDGAAMLDAVTHYILELDAAGQVDGEALMVDVLTRVAEVVADATKLTFEQLKPRTSLVVPGVLGAHRSGSMPDGEDWSVVYEWEVLVPEPRLSNVAALACLLEQVVGGLLFPTPVATADFDPQLRPWAKEHWLPDEPRYAGPTRPSDLVTCLPRDIWRLLGFSSVEPGSRDLPPAGSRAAQILDARLARSAPPRLWSHLLPATLRLAPLILCAASLRVSSETPEESEEEGEPTDDPAAALLGSGSDLDVAPRTLSFTRVASRSSHGRSSTRDVLQCGRSAQALRLCTLLFMRAMVLDSGRFREVLKAVTETLNEVVHTLGRASHNHLHLVLVTAEFAKSALIEQQRAEVNGAETTRTQDCRALVLELDNLIMRFRSELTITVMSREAASEVRMPVGSAGCLAFLMPARICCAAAAEVQWRWHLLRRHAAVAADRACSTQARHADADAALARARERAESCLAALVADDTERREKRMADMQHGELESARGLRRLLREVTGERQAWVPEGFVPPRHLRLSTIMDTQHRRLHLEVNHEARSYESRAATVAAEAAARAEPELAHLRGITTAGGADTLALEGVDADTLGGVESPRPEDSRLAGDEPVVDDGGATAGPASAALDDTAAVGHESRMVFGLEGCLLATPGSDAPGNVHVTGRRLVFTADEVSKSQSWLLKDVSEVHYSRHLLRRTALQLLFSPEAAQPPALIVAPDTSSKVALANAVLAAAPGAAFYNTSQKLSTAATAARRWSLGGMSNFDYLMLLNRLAGRTYDDLSQYPVFPWVLSDWSSAALDLSDPAVYRDLSKPMGALNPARLRQFEERYESMQRDADGPPFFYGTHYSSSGIVLWFLLRMEPFTRLAYALQGGRFDHADRLFHSLPQAWEQALTNSSDVKELIPELFYQPACLLNRDGLALGVQQGGKAVGDVQLPPWAGGDVHEFLRIHREALESEHVSSHLHEWIDLIFGYKQRGPHAVEAANVFHYLTYEGAIDLESIQSPRSRAAVQLQIREFGQTPMQLFTRRHPRRATSAPTLLPLLHAPDVVQRSQGTAPALPAGVSAAVVALALEDTGKGTRLVHVDAQQLVMAHRWHNTSHVMSYTFSAQVNSDFLIEPDPTPPRNLRATSGHDSIMQSAAAYATVPKTSLVITAGHYDNSIRVVDVDTGALLQVATLHRDAVSCLAVVSGISSSGSGLSLVAGSWDCMISVWHLRTPARSGKHATLLGSSPSLMLHGHDAPVTTLWASSSLRTLVSASAAGAVLLHHLPSGRLLRTLAQLQHAPTHLTGSALIPAAVIYSAGDRTLRTVHLQGDEMAVRQLPEAMNSMDISPCGRLVLVGGQRMDEAGPKGDEAGSGSLALHRRVAVPRLLWAHTLQTRMSYSLHMLPDEGDISVVLAQSAGCIIAGTTQGAVVLLSPDTRRAVEPHRNLADCVCVAD